MKFAITSRAIVASSIAALTAACGAAEGVYEDYEAHGDEELSSLEEALSTNESCDTATANDVNSGSFVQDNAITSPASYGSSSCAWGYLVDANDYDDIEGSGSTTFLGNSVRMSADTSANSEAECERMRVMVYIWRKNSNGSTTYLGSKSTWGKWEPYALWCDEQGQNCTEQFACTMPEVFLNDHFTMTEGLDYRIAASARRYSTPGGPGSFSLKKINIWNRSYRIN